jgi:hypothetical protein
MIGRPSLETVTAARERAETAARAIAAKLSGLHSELDQFIDIVIDEAIWTVDHVENAVLTEIGRRCRERNMEALEDRVLASVKEAPMQDRAALLMAELERCYRQFAAELDIEFKHYLAERARNAWEWAVEQLIPFSGMLKRRSVVGFKSSGPNSSLAAMERLRLIEASFSEPLGADDAGEVMIIAVEAAPAAWLRAIIAKYEMAAPQGKSLDKVTGLGVGRRWYNVEKKLREHAAIRAVATTYRKIPRLEAELARMRRQNPEIKVLGQRQLRRIVNAK